MSQDICRFCGAELSVTFANLGMTPLSNSYLNKDNLHKMEPFYPLHAYVCTECLLVQLSEFESPEHIFSDYQYFSSFSDSWLKHAKTYSDKMTERFGLSSDSQVVEIASNDGYLLQYFRDKNIPVLGVEPAANVAEVARKKGIPSEVMFFGEETAGKLKAAGKAADLMAANNVLAHVPDLNDFVKGFKVLLKPGGVITIEFPHLLSLIEHNQFDTIYHEHFSYFSLIVAEKVFSSKGLRIFDVEELSTHGGSLRLFICHNEDSSKTQSPAVESLKQKEIAFGLEKISTYTEFAEKIIKTKCDILDFFTEAKKKGKKVAGYGAPAKGNTLLNYCGIGVELLEYTVDRSPHKQKLSLPGTHIPIYAPEEIFQTKPDYIFILPWNIKDEVMEQMAEIRSWGGKFVIPIPEITII